MRKSTATLILIFLPMRLLAQDSIFDGIYSLLVPEQHAYATAQVRGEEAVIILLTGELWEPYVGVVDGNVLTASGVTSVVGVDIRLSVTFTSPSIVDITIDYCEPVTTALVCTYTAGTVLHGLKVF